MQQGERTTSIHGAHQAARGSLVTPIHQTSTFVLENAQDVDDVYEGRREGYVYSRYDNPTLRAVSEKIALLEGTQGAYVSASGMGAISATVLALVPTGGRIVATQDLYGGSINLFRMLQSRLGIRVDFVPTTSPEALREALQQKADLVWLETPTNPTLRLVDLAESARIAKAAGVVTAVDSTFASPINTKPHALGIDVVMHSATKYLGGHGDITAGVVCADEPILGKLVATHKMLGATLDPHAAFLLDRGLKTLSMRVEACNANAQAVAEHLARHPAVSKVHYPGLASHPQHALARKQMARGCGGLLSFDLESFDAAKRFLDRVKVIRNAASLGGVESLCSLPLQQSHRNQPKSVLDAAGIVPGTVRLAVGCEDLTDLLADLDQALGQA